MARTTRLELAISAVTAWREVVLQQLTTTRGLPKYLQVVQDSAICGLDCGLKISTRGSGIGYRRLARIRKIRIDC